jgi:transposase
MQEHIVNLPPRRRRRHSLEFKALVLQACMQPGVSVSAVALRHQLNANLVRRWISANAVASGTTATPQALPEFLPLAFTPSPTVQSAQEIVVEVRRGQTTATVRWPISASGDCAAWLQGWLR